MVYAIIVIGVIVLGAALYWFVFRKAGDAPALPQAPDQKLLPDKTKDPKARPQPKGAGAGGSTDGSAAGKADDKSRQAPSSAKGAKPETKKTESKKAESAGSDSDKVAGDAKDTEGKQAP
ncbi:MAG: hypothetical protein FWD57_03770, partial [Polyangiaceae bacterium]|nr:hypothetical protein [Polyangiaceae bacterium]